MVLLPAQPFGSKSSPEAALPTRLQTLSVAHRCTPSPRTNETMIRATTTLSRTFSAWPLTTPRTVSLIGAPQQFGQPRGGVENAPKLLRQAGLAETVSSLDWRVNDEGDVDMETTQDVAGPLRHAAQIGHGSQKLMEACVNAHERGNFVLTLGGDHSVALGTVAAAVKARPQRGAHRAQGHTVVAA